MTSNSRNTVGVSPPAPPDVDQANVDQANVDQPLNARSVALSALLGSHPPELPARALVALGSLFGIATGTMRTALSRMVSAGDVTVDDGRYRLGATLIDRQHSQDTGRRTRDTRDTWNGDWHTAIAVDDQRELTERRAFRSTMTNYRFGELRPDIWMRPANQPPPAATERLLITTGPLAGPAAAALARRLWSLEQIEADAQRLLTRLAHIETSIDWDDPASIPGVFTVSAAVVRFLRSEPGLPAELLPATWSVTELRQRYDVVDNSHQRLLRTFLQRP